MLICKYMPLFLAARRLALLRLSPHSAPCASPLQLPPGAAGAIFHREGALRCPTSHHPAQRATLKTNISCNITRYKAIICNTKWHRVAFFGASANAMTIIA
eukprot:6182651-Pleurochrysis_carterae.AAC.6